MTTRNKVRRHSDLLSEEEESLLTKVKYRPKGLVLNKKRLSKLELDEFFAGSEDEEDEDL